MLPYPTIPDEINDDILCKIGTDLMESNGEYQELNQKCVELYTTLKNNLAPEFHRELADYEAIMLLMQGIATVTAYQQGFTDGIASLKKSLTLTRSNKETPISNQGVSSAI